MIKEILPASLLLLGGMAYTFVHIVRSKDNVFRKGMELVLLAIVFIAMVAFFDVYGEGFNLAHVVYPTVLALFCMMSLLYKRDLMPQLNETMVLILTLLFWYSFYTYRSPMIRPATDPARHWGGVSYTTE